MYINPFICGVLSTILVELVIIIISATIVSTRKRRGTNNE